MVQSFWIGAIGFLVFFLSFLISRQRASHTGWFSQVLFLGFLSHILASVVGFIIIPGFNYWYNLSLFAFLWFCLFFIIAIYSASISVGIISFLYRNPNQEASKGAIFQACIKKPFTERVIIFLENGHVEKVRSGFQITASGKKSVRRILCIRKILGLSSSGFYSDSYQ